MKYIIDALVISVLALSFLMCEIMNRKNLKRRSGICWEYNRELILGIQDEEYTIEMDLFPDKRILKMHNSGTKLEDEVDRLEFKMIATEEDIFGK